MGVLLWVVVILYLGITLALTVSRFLEYLSDKDASDSYLQIVTEEDVQESAEKVVYTFLWPVHIIQYLAQMLAEFKKDLGR